jgi:OOP family OmpA-OmpF porin
MNRSRTAVQVIASLMLLGGSVGAIAADPGAYVGASVGQTELDMGTGDLQSILGATGFVASTDNTDVGWKVFGGYQFNPYFAVEAAYVNLGEFTASGFFAGSPAHGSAEGDAGLFSLVGTLPLGDAFDLSAKVGAIVWDVDTSVAGSFGTSETNFNGTTLAYGIGAAWNITQEIGIRGELERFKDLGPDYKEVDLDLYSLGAVFHF